MSNFSRAAHNRLVLGASLSVTALLLSGAATAQVADPATQPTANPTAPAQVQSTDASVDPTPAPDAAAQVATPAPGEGEDIVVTGFRAALASSANIKRNATLIVDSVSSEDIGKLPDVSIADSLARLPGVTAQRLEGRDQRLSIRGLGPDFSTTLLNGREQVTVGDNRGVEFDQYPSEFFKNVNVYKSADASLVAAGISGTVDLRMLRPLDQPERVVVLAARGQMNEQKKLNPDGSRYGYRVSGTFVDKFANDTLGIAIGASAQTTPSQNERYNAWGFPNAPEVQGALILGGAKPYVQSNELKRYGGVATIEWEPSDNFHSTFDALYSNFEETQRLRGIEFPINPGWGSNATIAPGYTVTDGLVTDATITNVVAVQRNDYNKRTAENLSLGWNNNFKLNDRLQLNVDASWSRATRTDFLLETYSGTGYQANLDPNAVKDTIRISANKDGTFDIVPTLDYTDTNQIKLTDPRGWGFNGSTAVVQAGFLNRPDFTDDLKSLRANLTGEFDNSVVKSWEVGGNYSRRKKASRYTSFFLCPKGGTDCTIANGTPGAIPVPQDVILKDTVSLDYLGVPAMLTLNPLKVYGLLDAVFDDRPGSLVRDNTVTEDVYTGYAKLTIDGEVGGKALKGALGLQVVHTKQSSNGGVATLVGNTVTAVDVSGNDSYTDFLPSATMSVELMDNFFVKLGASQTMVRARLDQLRISQDVTFSAGNIGQGVNNPVFSSNGGNIALRPYQSTNIDLSVEKYIGGGGYLALSGYFKDLTDFVDPNNNTPFDFSALLSALTPAQQAAILAAGQQIGPVKIPANSGGGYLLGIEATASIPFGTVTSVLDGFGIFASGTWTESSVKYGSNPTEALTLPGLSKWVATGTAYFEKYGFQARVTYRYRSDFLAEIAGLSANPEFRTGSGEGVLDAQIGYEFQSGPLTGLSILAQAKNLTDQPFVTYEQNDPRLVRDYQRYGRDYYLGVTYKF
ncbi:TonB-dependent receptor [Sphingomonas sp. SUN019]|uniref:TonB-dependent receptor n=1 Tax=Sphingomonas sp. SUN019 TaxID=2937788 RepID=UPI0021644057|nr:TonB-dependent receptor [Sphingomonas sp. SUN019]UVO51865.1 TonB-dependent receptor [Sphingomonas sp. SUN019]